MISDILASTIPQQILAKTTKSEIVEHMVDVWNILYILLPLVKLGRAEEHDLQSYLQLLDAIEKSCYRELAEAQRPECEVCQDFATGEGVQIQEVAWLWC
jgi:hypothetical protein